MVTDCLSDDGLFNPPLYPAIALIGIVSPYIAMPTSNHKGLICELEANWGIECFSDFITEGNLRRCDLGCGQLLVLILALVPARYQ